MPNGSNLAKLWILTDWKWIEEKKKIYKIFCIVDKLLNNNVIYLTERYCISMAFRSISVPALTPMTDFEKTPA